MSRLEEIRTNLVARPQEAMEQCWLGEVAAIETTMAAAAQKVESRAGTGGATPATDLGMPELRSALGRFSPSI
jgi:hypothetical protein